MNKVLYEFISSNKKKILLLLITAWKIQVDFAWYNFLHVVKDRSLFCKHIPLNNKIF